MFPSGATCLSADFCFNDLYSYWSMETKRSHQVPGIASLTPGVTTALSNRIDVF